MPSNNSIDSSNVNESDNKQFVNVYNGNNSNHIIITNECQTETEEPLLTSTILVTTTPKKPSVKHRCPPRPSLISHHKLSFCSDNDCDRVDALPKHMSFTILDAA